MARLLIVSNRLPITVLRDPQRLRVERSAGGLASGLSGPHASSDTLWIGWPGDTGELDRDERATLDAQLDEMRAVAVDLDPEDVKGFYEGYSNGILWPLFHYMPGRVPLVVRDFDVYERANERFAEAVLAHYQPDDLIWVHDYHLMLLPKMLRDRVPEARIGFFLHIPFPAAELFRTLPNRDRILEGLLGADLVGFHTPGYMRSFASSLLQVLGIAAEMDRVRYRDRSVRLGAFPMGIDTEKFEGLAESPEVGEQVERLRGGDGCSVFLGIDRLDYTKGIRRRLLAFEHLLENRAELRERIRLIQLVVPSRTGVVEYQDFRHEVEALVGRINGVFGTPRWVPIHYIYRSVSDVELVALYRAADAMLVTPVRDGMNLVAKEFVASRTDEEGVLVLSELAGAASELAEALMVNPYDVERTADSYHRALTMPRNERRARMRALRRRVLSYDVHVWLRSYVHALEEASDSPTRQALAATRPAEIAALVRRMREADHLLLLLGYDGTLVPLADVPELSMPDESLLDLLAALAARPGTEIHVVSGSSREMVETRFGELPIDLHAEYGFWSRAANNGGWVSRPRPPLEWRARVLPILRAFAARTPGSLIEEKSVSVAWHYRMAEPVYGAFQANELRSHLSQFLSNEPVEIVSDEKVIEVRPFSVNKGSIVPALLPRIRPGTLVVAMGDGQSDEELFAALPEGSVAIHVGSKPSRADVRVLSFEAARRMLAALLDETIAKTG